MSHSYESLGSQRERTLSYLTLRGVPEQTARLLGAALIGATFEAWIQWAVGTDPDPVPHLVAATDILRLPPTMD